MILSLDFVVRTEQLQDRSVFYRGLGAVSHNAICHEPLSYKSPRHVLAFSAWQRKHVFAEEPKDPYWKQVRYTLGPQYMEGRLRI